MDRNLPLKPTLAFLACFILIIGAFLYFAPVTVKPPIGQIYRNADEQLIALESHYLVGLSKSSETVSMESFVNGSHVGQLISLRSGELIVNGKGQSRDILLNFRSLFRISDAKDDVATTSLLKCDANMATCQPWGDSGLIFRMGWSGLELRDGQIIINDSTRHRVLLLSPDGKVLSELGGFKFPNHAEEVNDTIWITDTNHHQIVEIRVDDGTLTRTGEKIALGDYSGIQRQHRFPSIAALDAENHWWVMANDHNMARPAIYRLNTDQTATQIAHEIDDATAMLAEDSQLFIASYPDNQVWHFDTQTLTGAPFPSEQLTEVNAIVEQQVATQKRNMWLTIVALGLLALSFLVYAIKKSTPIERQSLSINDDLLESNDINHLSQPKVSGIVWIAKQKKFERQVNYFNRALRLLIPAMVLIIGSLIIFVVFSRSEIGDSLSLIMTLGLAVFIVFITYFSTKRTIQGFTEYELGADKNHLILRHIKTDKRTIVLGKDIEYTQHAFYAGGVFFQLADSSLKCNAPESRFYFKWCLVT